MTTDCSLLSTSNSELLGDDAGDETISEILNCDADVGAYRVHESRR